MARGLLVEQMIAQFSSEFFMKDFVYWNVKFQSGGQTKSHPADLLFVLDDECIVVSLKGTDGEPKSEARLRLWLEKKCWAGSQSAKVGIQRLAVPFSAENLWGERREFAAERLRARCGVSVLECPQEPFRELRFEIRQPDSTVPIHVLSANDLMNVVRWLGSIWDVFHYFAKRTVIRDTFAGINRERTALAHYVLVDPDFKGYADSNKEHLDQRFQLHMLENLDRYAERDRFSHYVNSIVRELHTRHPNPEAFTPPESLHYLEPSGQRSAYLKMAAMLNGLPSSNKANIGRHLHEMLTGLKGSGMCGCHAHKQVEGDVVFVFCGFSGMARMERIRNLHRLVDAALLRYGVNEALGVGIDADDETTGYDLRWVRGRPVVSVEIERIADEVFGRSFEVSIADPFGRARPYSV